MNSNTRGIVIAVILSIVVVFGWNFFFGKKEATVTKQVTNKSMAVTNPLSLGIKTNKEPPKYVTLDAALAGPKVNIANDNIKGSIAKKGAVINYLSLLKYKVSVKKDSKNVELLSPIGVQYPYYASFSWLSSDTVVPNKNTIWTSSSNELTPSHPVYLSYTNPDGVKFTHKFSVDKNFLISVSSSVVNSSKKSITISPYSLISRTGERNVKNIYILHEGPVGVFSGSLKEDSYKDVKEDGRINYPTKGGWIGFTDKYWLVALIGNNNSNLQAEYISGNDKNGHTIYQADFLANKKTLEVGQKYDSNFRLFAGAKTTKILDTYMKKYSIPHFDRAIDFGWFYFITKPLLLLLNMIDNFLGNFGLAILLLTVVVRLLLYPLSKKSMVASYNMNRLQPQIKELKKIYADDKTRLSKETFALYKREGVSPVSGCLPVVIQIPIFFALYKVFYITIEMRHAPFFGWIRDLSAPDPYGILTGFGFFHWQIPVALSHFNIGIWPIIMGLTMFFQQKFNMTKVTDPLQKKLFTFMPLIFVFILGSFPVGLVIYWSWNNTLSVIQQLWINHNLKRKYASK